ncbi:MAG: twin-arginine translocase TatA/TatE family subunit [Coriobacteriaceae bacterium]|nr:twin-arginine translocase TatA/TatE family subunit [Coriobacteriaceae bacterium]
MKILGMGLPELLIILAVALLIFGPKNLPKLGSAIGSTVKNLRDGLGEGKGAKDEAIEEIVEDDEEGQASRRVTKAFEGETAKKATSRKAAPKKKVSAE